VTLDRYKGDMVEEVTPQEGPMYAVYRMFNIQKELIYIGCTGRLAKRFHQHAQIKDWASEIATVAVTWYQDRQEAFTAEGQGIFDEAPKYNMKRGDPKTWLDPEYTPCPKCGTPKQRQSAYCKPCTNQYRAAKALADGKVPRGEPTTVCPKCGGEKAQGPNYCPPCKRQYGKDRRARMALEARS